MVVCTATVITCPTFSHIQKNYCLNFCNKFLHVAYCLAVWMRQQRGGSVDLQRNGAACGSSSGLCWSQVVKAECGAAGVGHWQKPVPTMFYLKQSRTCQLWEWLSCSEPVANNTSVVDSVSAWAIYLKVCLDDHCGHLPIEYSVNLWTWQNRQHVKVITKLHSSWTCTLIYTTDIGFRNFLEGLTE